MNTPFYKTKKFKYIFNSIWAIALMFVAIFLPLYFGLAWNDLVSYIILVIAIFMGIIVTILLAEQNKYASLIAAAEVSLWAYINYRFGAYSMAVSMIVIGVLFIMTYLNWNKHTEKGVNTTKANDKLTKEQWVYTVCAVLVIFGSLYFINFYGLNNDLVTSIGDSIAAGITLVGAYFIYSRREEQWILWLALNLVFVVWMSIELVVSPNPISLMTICTSSLHGIYTIFALMLWKDKREEAK